MKMKQLLVACGVAAALCLSAVVASAQDNGGGGGGGGGGQGGGGGGFGGGGRGNFDPAQFQQRMMDNIRDQLGFTNDTDWSAVQPLVQKVMDARRETMSNMRGMFGRNRGGGNRPNRNPFGGTPNPDAEALQKAVDDDAPAGQIKDLLAKYKTSMKAKQDALVAAQDALRQVLTTKQEAQATLMGLL